MALSENQARIDRGSGSPKASQLCRCFRADVLLKISQPCGVPLARLRRQPFQRYHMQADAAMLPPPLALEALLRIERSSLLVPFFKARTNPFSKQWKR